MTTGCEIITDLIPLYLDDVCSEDSRRAVEKHISECESCRSEFSRMKQDIKVPSPLPSEEDIMKKISWTITKKELTSACGIFAVILYLAMFLWQRKAGLTGSPYCNYQLYRLLQLLFIPVIILTLLWLILTAVSCAKRNSAGTKLPLIILLALIMVIQGFICRHILLMQENMLWSEIVEIPNPNQIVIEKYDGSLVLLDTDYTVTNLVRADGTEYVIYYTANIKTPEKGELLWIIHSENADTGNAG